MTKNCEEGIFKIIIHGRPEFFMKIDGKYHITEKSKKGFQFIETVIDSERIEKATPVSMEEILILLNTRQRQ